MSLSGRIETSAPGDPTRPRTGFWEVFARSFWAFAFSFWALMGAACSAILFFLSMGPLQACGTYGIWITLAPPEFFPSWTGLGSHGPLEFTRAHLGLASWLLALIVFPVVGSRLSKVQWRRWRPKAWAYAAMAGTALAVLALFSYRIPPAPEAYAGILCDPSLPISHVTAPIIDWYEIPATIGFLVLAAAMWRILIARGGKASR